MPGDLDDVKSTSVQVMQAITSANADHDLCCHMASQGHNELTHYGLVAPYGGIELPSSL